MGIGREVKDQLRDARERGFLRRLLRADYKGSRVSFEFRRHEYRGTFMWYGGVTFKAEVLLGEDLLFETPKVEGYDEVFGLVEAWFSRPAPSFWERL